MKWSELSLAKYIIKRLLLVLPIVMLVMLVIYGLMYSTIAPGSHRHPANLPPTDAVDTVMEALGLSDTFIAAYARYVSNVVTDGIFASEAFTLQLKKGVSITLQLTLTSFAISVLLGIPLGIVSAVKRDGALDNTVSSFTSFFASVPSYTLGLILLIIFAVNLKVLPISGTGRPGSFVLPIVTLSASGIATTVRLARASLIEVLDQQYITFLRVKGMKGWKLLFEHALKNAMLPIAANMSKVISQLLCGSMVVEFFFSLPGIGLLMKQAIDARDPKEVMGCGFMIALVITIANILTDILYMAVNPAVRNRLAGEKKGK